MTICKRWAFAGAVGALLLGMASWQSYVSTVQAQGAPRHRPMAASAAQTRLVKAAITAQLDAFRRDDYAGAEKYQSSQLRAHFGSTAAFRKAIKTAYPQFAHYQSVKFAPMKTDKTGAVVLAPVTVTGVDGVDIVAIYIMVREKAGFRVDGVQTAPDAVPPPKAAPTAPDGSVVT